MDTTDPNITFDANGECCYCKIYDQRVKNEVFRGSEGAMRLAQIVEIIKKGGEGKTYDCLIGVSGGVDSTTVVLQLKKLGLRPLALHLDNGWDSELAVDNIKNTLAKLDIDLYTYVLDWDEFRDLQLAFLKASVPNAEIPTDHAIVAINFQMAMKHRIKYIVNGGNVSTESFVPVAWAYDARDQRHLKAIHKQFGTVPLRTFPTMGIPGYLYAVLIKGIRWFTLLNYIYYQKTDALKVLQEELGWRPYGGKHYESVYTRFYQGYILKQKFGFDKKRAHLANLVLSGDISRKKALAEVQEEDYIGTDIYFEDREFTVKKFGLSEAQFEEIMSLPVKTHYDYPNNSWALEKMPKVFAFFKRFVTRI
ncbi:MAG: N-acetyl sugar amidotransferase [Syntrophales bacterium LBB04]|nr:N-acetyl sugar amidotransferase [Syntrophales bacterium LBB04]